MTNETSPIEAKALDMMDSLQNVAHDITTKLIETAPKAFEIICNIKRIDCLGSIVSGLATSIVSMVAYKALRKFMDKVNKADYSDADGWIFLCFISGAVLTGTLINSCMELSNIWNWVGVIKPDLAIAKDLYTAAIEKVK